MKKNLIYFIIYFLYGAVAIVSLSGFALLYVDVGFSKSQTSTLISIAFLGVLIQPIIGYACDLTKRRILILQIGTLITIFCALLMIYSSNYILYLVTVFLIAAFRFSVFSILDVIILSETNDDVFTKIRTGATYGFAIGIFFLIPVEMYSSFDFVLYALVVFNILALLLFTQVKENKSCEHTTSKEYFSDLKLIIKNRKVILLMFTNMVAITVLMQKIAYSNILFETLGFTMLTIALLSFVAEIPEAILLPIYNKTFNKFSLKMQILMLMIASMLQTVIFIFTKNVYLIYFFIGMQGLVYAIQIPLIYTNLNKELDEKISSTGFLINTMFQSIGSFIIGIVILKPLYSNYGLKEVFIALTLICLLLVIPLFLYKEKE